MADDGTRYTGTVIRFYGKRGFGFVKPSEGGSQVFVHWEDITTSNKWPRLERDMVVEYSLGTGEDGKKRAKEVTLEGGAEVWVEDEADNRQLSKTRTTGVVKFFAKAGFGFITTNKAISWPMKLPAGSEIYVGREDIQVAEDSLCRLQQGQEVEFNVYKKEGKEGVAAANVTEVGGEAISIEKGSGKGSGKGKGKKSGGKAGGVQKTIAKPQVPVKTPVAAKGKGSKGAAAGGKSKGKGKSWW